MGGRQAVNETGNKYGKWTVIERAPRKSKKVAYWLCQCECGRKIEVSGGALRNGMSTQCRWCGNSGFRDLSGERFGKWIVLKRAKAPEGYHKAVYYLVRCDCSNESKVQAGALRSGKTKQCWECGHFLPAGEAAFNQVYKMYIRHAKERDLAWRLSREQFRKLTQQKCHWCNLEPSTERITDSKNGAFIYNGVDRRDNDEGYTRENSVPCCSECNAAKGSRSMKEWTEWTARLVKNYRIDW